MNEHAADIRMLGIFSNTSTHIGTSYAAICSNEARLTTLSRNGNVCRARYTRDRNNTSAIKYRVSRVSYFRRTYFCVYIGRHTFADRSSPTSLALISETACASRSTVNPWKAGSVLRPDDNSQFVILRRYYVQRLSFC